ncbi:MAG: hypothetical protein WC727_11070 [Ignavibacteriaceae bacterium]
MNKQELDSLQYTMMILVSFISKGFSVSFEISHIPTGLTTYELILNLFD